MTLVALLVLLAGCRLGGGEPWEAGTITLRAGELRALGGGALLIGFERVLSDSRCPQNARCFQAGEATARVWLRPRGAARTFLSLRLPGGMMGPDTSGRVSVDTLGVRVALLQLDPYPGAPSMDARPRAVLRVAPAGR